MLIKLRKYASRLPRKLPNQRRFWEFHYVEKTPPPFHSAHEAFWAEFASVVFDRECGPLEKRRSAQLKHIEGFVTNPHVITAPVGSDQHELYAKQNRKFSTLEEREKRHLEQIAEETERFTNAPDTPQAPKNEADWKYQSSPCILAVPEVQTYCEKSIIKRAGKKAKKQHNQLQSAEAVYNQLKKEVIRSLLKLLPKGG